MGRFEKVPVIIRGCYKDEKFKRYRFGPIRLNFRALFDEVIPMPGFVSTIQRDFWAKTAKSFGIKIR